MDLEQQRKETAKIQQASNDELDKVQLADGATGWCERSQVAPLGGALTHRWRCDRAVHLDPGRTAGTRVGLVCLVWLEIITN